MTKSKPRFFYSLLCLLFIASGLQAQSSLQSPDEFLGYKLGTHWTPHYKVLGYFKYVAEQSPLVSFEQYGTTNEGRELSIVKVTSRENQGRLEQIRTDNLKRAHLMEGEPATNIPIVWLSYNVHGNETSSSEAAMKTLYELVRPGNAKAKQWLQNTLVIMDPMINPDGRDRYVHWYNSVVGDQFNAHGDAREHHEPWPGGRTNHYYFDLNRDWAWLTQKESRARLALYNKWLPQIHVDYHEQGYNSPYYFAPGAEPFHKAITDWQREFQYTIGKNNAKYFDQNSWLYFTRESFDLFYPSYGDTYPIFNGAIGMTYEQAGGGYAGLGIIKEEGDTLSLRDRLMHHYTTGMSTVEISSKDGQQLLDHFSEYYDTAVNNPAGKYKAYVIKADNDPAKVKALLHLLDEQGIRYGKAADARSMNGYHYQSGKTEKFSFSKDDYVISAYQPKSVLARTFFEPRPELSDSLTYDITAWELHYAYGLDGYATTDRIKVNDAPAPALQVNNQTNSNAYAYLAEWHDLADVQMLTALLKKGVKVRVAEEPFTIDGKKYAEGTLVIARNGNTHMGSAFDEAVKEAADHFHKQLYPVSTGFVTSGHDFGSSSVVYLKPPRIALLSGEGTSSGNVGEIWHYFDRQVNYPVTLINVDDFRGVNLNNYDVLILPSGYYGNMISKNRWQEVSDWVSAGGKLIAIQGANRMLAGREGFALKQKTMKKDEGKKENPDDKLEVYANRRRDRASNLNAGSIFKIDMDTTHPLAFGYGKEYYSLKLSSDAYDYLDNGWNVGVAKENAKMSGFAGIEAQKELANTLTFGVQNKGRGTVVYMVDNPLFRAFWYNGKLLFSNAVFLVGQ